MQRGTFMSSWLVKGKTGLPALFVGASPLRVEFCLQHTDVVDEEVGLVRA